MEALFSICVAILVACGVYLLLRGRTFPVILGITLLSYATNLFLFSMGRLKTNASNLLNDGLGMVDPLPQALVLTAIVISFAMTAFVSVLAIRARGDFGSDHVNGRRQQERQEQETQKPSEQKETL